jgi:hypothetical protein
LSEHADHRGFTKVVVKRVLTGEQRGDSLFTVIPRYFGYDDRAAFWNRVLFFNFIPDCIGTSSNKYAVGDAQQIRSARERFERILQKEKPDKVFVFTTKGWKECPETVKEKRHESCTQLGEGFKDITWGKYVFNGHTVMAFGLRHPQYANKEHMRAAVKEALSRN